MSYNQDSFFMCYLVTVLFLKTLASLKTTLVVINMNEAFKLKNKMEFGSAFTEKIDEYRYGHKESYKLKI